MRLRWMCKVKGDGAGDDGDEYESKVECNRIWRVKVNEDGNGRYPGR